MFKGQPGGGFTIIEVMIFLTVSLVVFGGAVVTISRQNNRIAFAQSARDVEVQLQDIFNDVENGYYPSNNDFRCVANSSGVFASPLFGAREQGKNEGCIFIGKAIQFGRNSQDDQIATATIIGKRLNGDEDVTRIQDAKPTLLEATVGEKNIYNINSGVEIDGLYYNHPTFGKFIEFSGIAVISGFADQDGGSLESGIVRTSLSPLGLTLSGGQGVGSSDNNFLSYVNNMDGTAFEQGVVLCLQEKGGGRIAEINIGVESQRLATSSSVDPASGVCVS